MDSGKQGDRATVSRDFGSLIYGSGQVCRGFQLLGTLSHAEFAVALRGVYTHLQPYERSGEREDSVCESVPKS